MTYGDKSFTWVDGRNLVTITDSSNNDSISYTYNRYGYRTGKTINGVATNYIVDENGTVVAQKTGNDTLYFEYDNYGSPLGFVYNGIQYLCITNIRNDVIAITDTAGVVLASYTYGDWGECTVDSTSTNLALANLNPLRYRGYYYDNETGYYYLQSRYYDPSICRFINADVPKIAKMSKDIPVGTNLFAYCNNNPINDSDPTGSISISAIIGAIIGFGAGVILLPLFADYKGYKGNKRKWFIGLGTAITTVIGGVLGHYIGKALIALYSKGKVFADILNKAIAKSIAKITRVSFSVAKGEGYKLTFGKYVIRIMTSSKRVNNYIRISHITKGAMLLNGTFSSDRSLTHISITISNLVKLVSLIFKLK